VQLLYIHLIMDKTDTADLSGGAFTSLIGVIWPIKIQNLLPFHKSCQKLANRGVTKETLSCTAAL